jgi:hypothetical protein
MYPGQCAEFCVCRDDRIWPFATFHGIASILSLSERSRLSTNGSGPIYKYQPYRSSCESAQLAILDHAEAAPVTETREFSLSEAHHLIAAGRRRSKQVKKWTADHLGKWNEILPKRCFDMVREGPAQKPPPPKEPYPAEKARGGEIILRIPARRAIFLAGIIGAVVLAAIVLFLTR